MKLQKIILSIVVALTAFGASLGLLEIGNYLRTGFQPLKMEVKPKIPQLAPITYYPPRSAEYKAPPVYVPPVIAESDDEDSCELDQEGDYVIIGSNPKDFKDFSFVSIVTTFYNSKTDQAIPIKPYGWIEATNKYKFTWLNMTNRKISFVTQSKKGVSYQFDGKFVDEEIKLKDENKEEYKEKVLLKGRLTKWRNGIKIAEAKVKFAGNCGC